MEHKNPEPHGLPVPQETIDRLRPHAAMGVIRLSAIIGISRTALLTAMAGFPVYYSTSRKIRQYLDQVEGAK